MLDFFYAVIDQIILFRITIIVTIIGVLIILALFLTVTARFNWLSRNIRIIGFCYAMRRKEAMMISVCMLKYFLAISLFFYQGHIYPIHMVAYGALTVVYILMRRTVKDMLVSLFNGAVIMASLYLANFLISYLVNIYHDNMIMAILVCLIVFIVLYTIYDMIWCIMHIVTQRDKKDRGYGADDDIDPDTMGYIRDKIDEKLPGIKGAMRNISKRAQTTKLAKVTEQCLKKIRKAKR